MAALEGALQKNEQQLIQIDMSLITQALHSNMIAIIQKKASPSNTGATMISALDRMSLHADLSV